MIYKNEMNRRNFFKNSTIGIVGAGLMGSKFFLEGEENAKDEPLKIKAYRTLGRTGFKASDISFGDGLISHPIVIKALLEAGINYIDTAEKYYPSEERIGKIIKDFDRKSLFITTKLGLKRNFTKEEVLARTRKCLERLQCDYVDCMMIHDCLDKKTLKGEGFHAAMRQLKSEGRVRFLGVANHGATFGESQETMEDVLMAAVADGRFDIVMLAYNFIQREMGERILKACAEKNIGTVAMKTKPVEHYFDFMEGYKKRKAIGDKRGEKVPEPTKRAVAAFEARMDAAKKFLKKNNLISPEEIRDASVRFVMNNPHLNTVCTSFKNFGAVRTYLRLSGGFMSAEDKKKLTLYREGCGDLYCRHACGRCEPQCPHGVPVNTIMRYNHYFEVQGREKYAMEKYAALPITKANICSTCPGNCEKACPHNVPIHSRLIMAHQNLTLS